MSFYGFVRDMRQTTCVSVWQYHSVSLKKMKVVWNYPSSHWHTSLMTSHWRWRCTPWYWRSHCRYRAALWGTPWWRHQLQLQSQSWRHRPSRWFRQQWWWVMVRYDLQQRQNIRNLTLSKTCCIQLAMVDSRPRLRCATHDGKVYTCWSLSLSINLVAINAVSKHDYCCFAVLSSLRPAIVTPVRCTKPEVHNYGNAVRR